MSEKKIEQFWRDATTDDIAKVMRGEKVEARFRDEDRESWRERCFLSGWRLNGEHNWAGDTPGWKQCQVYDPPEWYVNKPDPGEGYRLLEKFPHEPKLRHDWYWNEDRSVWVLVGSDGEQAEDVWYRRRIEPNTPEISDSCVAYESKVGEVIQLPNGKRLKVTQSGFEVL